jgi:hypothetical protein
MTFMLIMYLLCDLAFIGLFSYWLFHDFEYKWKYIFHKLDEHHQDFIKQSNLWNSFVCGLIAALLSIVSIN